tara:strand:- start:14 stop:214 length:201 start_codon:yes stop_codon:yes gene_type:complete
MSKKKPLSKPLSLRLSSSVRETVSKISDETGLTQAQLFEMILRAGCTAIEKKDRKFRLPLSFEVVE